MQEVFKNASSFDQNISAWNVSKVNNMIMMFYDATAFNQDLQNWNAPNLPSDQCTDFAIGADAWLAQYGGSVAKTPPLSTSMINANCGL
jgi:surface protein